MEAFVPKYLHFSISEAKKTAGVQCCAFGCTKKPNYKKRGLCHGHYSRWRRIQDPVYERYKNFRTNALKRSKEFTITLDEFRDFCDRTGYITKKGMRGLRCTVDRIRNWEGYHIGNIQILSNADNVNKYHKHDKHFTELDPDDPDHLPF